jgi:AmmeMemoRadiSam system protein B/AmmeMemoRadiSam system protein A
MKLSESQRIRRPAVAGQFYPGNPVELTKTIAGFFAEVDKVAIGGRPVALVAPHAGYMYSGKVAAKAYKLLEGEDVETVVIVSPSHTVFFKGCSVYDGDGYETPLGVVDIDKDMVARLTEIHPHVYKSSQGHATGMTRGEHALEVHLPFLQIALGKFKLVPIVMGDQEEDTIRALGESLGGILQGVSALLVASTDLSHFHAESTARKLDFAVQSAIEKYSPDDLLAVLQAGQGEACGGGPVAAVLIASRWLGGESVRFLDYATSGNVTGQFDEVVGYMSAAVVGAPNRVTRPETAGATVARPKTALDLTDEDKQALLKIAEDAIRAKFAGDEYKPVPSERLEMEQGAFVTLTINGELRGCIGQIRARGPVLETVADMAVNAAFNDPRFNPLDEDEFSDVDIEISVLSPLERVRDINQIVVGRDGLMIKLDWHSGLLLPQVASEYGWSVIEFLEQTCLKAGLSKNSYRDKFAEIYRFSAVVFS